MVSMSACPCLPVRVCMSVSACLLQPERDSGDLRALSAGNDPNAPGGPRSVPPLQRQRVRHITSTTTTSSTIITPNTITSKHLHPRPWTCRHLAFAHMRQLSLNSPVHIPTTTTKQQQQQQQQPNYNVSVLLARLRQGDDGCALADPGLPRARPFAAAKEIPRAPRRDIRPDKEGQAPTVE